ncbi:MAG: hypothetical protein ACOX8R_05190 [Bacillota bacterium]|jgi:hypothetical protein
MTVRELLDYVGRVKPSAYTEADLLMWLDEIEGIIEADVLLREDFRPPYVLSADWRGQGITFPDDHTLVLPSACVFCPGGEITLSGAVTYGADNGVYTLTEVSADGRTLTVAEGAFAAVGDAPETASVTLAYDGGGAELLIGLPHQRVYYTYLLAMIDFMNAEYGKYQNDMALFNSFWECFVRWYGQTRRPADR